MKKTTSIFMSIFGKRGTRSERGQEIRAAKKRCNLQQHVMIVNIDFINMEDLREEYLS